MSVSVVDSPDVRVRAQDLGLPSPEGLAFLPRHWETAKSSQELQHEPDTSTLRKLFHEAGLTIKQLQPADRLLPTPAQKSVDWLPPIIFVGGMLATQNPYAIQLALNVLGTYLADLLRTRRPIPQVQLTFVLETTRTRSYKKLTYEGPVSGIKDLATQLRELQHD